MLHTYYHDYDLKPTKKQCPVCDTLLQILTAKIPHSLYPDYYLCPNEECKFLGSPDISQVITARTQFKELKIELVDFTVNRITGYEGTSFLFTENVFGFTPTQHTWDFGDGNVVTTQNKIIYHSYDNVGTYTVKLTVDHPTENTKEVIKEELILIQPYENPVAEFVTDIVFGHEGVVVNFRDISLGSDIIGWEWDFGDGSPKSYFQNPTHIFETAGKFDITLTINNSKHQQASIIKNEYITVIHQLPVITNFVSNIQHGFTDELISFYYTSTGFIDTVFWEFGDGDTSNEQYPSHLYNTPGIYDVKLTVSNPSGQDVLFKNGYINVRDYRPLNLIYDVFPGSQDLFPSNYRLSALRSTGEISDYAWFENGTLLSIAPEYDIIFTESGSRDIMLRLKDTRGNILEETKTITR